MVGWESIVHDAVGPAYNVILGLLFIVLIALMIWFFITQMSFIHPGLVREIINNKKTIIHQTKWKFAKDKDGVEGIMFQKPKLFVPITENNQLAFDPTPGGKKFVEVELMPNGEVEFVYYEAKTQQFQPLTTKQRSILVTQTINAQKRRKHSLFDTIEKVAPIVALTIIVVSLMMFYADMGQPLLQMGDKIVQSKEIDLQILEQLDALKNDVQIIKGEIAPEIIQGNNTISKSTIPN